MANLPPADLAHPTGDVDLGPPVSPGPPGASDLTFLIALDAKPHAISPYIYGANQVPPGSTFHYPFTRAGGDRWTNYNWETNASNAGYDNPGQPWQGQNDDDLSSSKTPGDAVWQAVSAAWPNSATPTAATNKAIVITVPVQGYVAADENAGGDTGTTPGILTTRFFPQILVKGSALTLTPDLTDKKVYADEMVHWLESTAATKYPSGHAQLFYGIDNEPDDWAGTHANTQQSAVTYAQLLGDSTTAAAMIKQQAPESLVFGPTLGGWYGYSSLAGAPDAAGRDFVNTYLDTFATADGKSKTRTLDVLDLHWYPQESVDPTSTHGATVDGDSTAAAYVKVRVQTTRSLWDPNYVENSWISGPNDVDVGAIDLLDREQANIAAHYPGTKLAITEYYYGGGNDISGAIAQADALGAFGRKNLFAGAMWHEGGTNDQYIDAAFGLYLAHFGDVSMSASSSDVAKATVWASTFSDGSGKVAVVAINKTGGVLKAGITLELNETLSGGTVYVLTSKSTTPTSSAVTLSATNAIDYAMPAMSVSLLVLDK